MGVRSGSVTEDDVEAYKFTFQRKHHQFDYSNIIIITIITTDKSKICLYSYRLLSREEQLDIIFSAYSGTECCFSLELP